METNHINQTSNPDVPVDFETFHIASLAAANDSCEEVIQLYPAKPQGRCTAFEVGGFKIVRESWNQVYQTTTRPSDEHMVVCFSLDAEQPGKVSGKPFQAGDVLLIPGGSQHKVVIPPTQFVSIQINAKQSRTNAFNAVMEQRIPLIVPSGCATNTLSKITLRLTEAAVARARGDAPLPTNHTNQDAMRQALDDVLNRARSCEPQAIPDLAWTSISRAQDYMRSNLADKVALNDVSQSAAVSQRTLEYNFKRTLNISPVRFLRVLRLNEARRRLAEARQSVTYIASDCGFSHMSHFSAGYLSMFGERPSETVRRARG